MSCGATAGVYLAGGGFLQRITDIDAPIWIGPEGPAEVILIFPSGTQVGINDSGTVVLNAYWDVGAGSGSTIFRIDAPDQLVNVTDPRTGVYRSAFWPSINNPAEIAFVDEFRRGLGTLAPDGASGVFTLTFHVDTFVLQSSSNTLHLGVAYEIRTESAPVSRREVLDTRFFLESPSANLWLSMTAIPTVIEHPVPGVDSIDYVLIVGNAGPGAAHDIRVVFTLPAGTTFVRATLFNQLLSRECSQPRGSTEVVCDLYPRPARLLESFDLRITVQLAALVGNGATAFAYVTAAEPDTMPENNSAVAFTSFGGGLLSDVAVSPIAFSEDPIVVGGSLVYTFLVTNNGPETARNVLVHYPFEYLFPLHPLVSVSSTTGCSNPSSEWETTCAVGDIEPGRTVLLAVMRRISHGPGSYQVRAYARADGPEVTYGNNDVEVTFSVMAPFGPR